MAELSEKEKYARKAKLLQKALAEADVMDKADVEKAAAATGKKKKETAA